MEPKVGIGKHAKMVMKTAVPAPTSAPAALWQMLLAAAPEIASGSLAHRGGPGFASIGEISGVRNLDVLDLIRRRKILMTTMQPQTVVIEPAFEQRLRHFFACIPPGPVQDRFIRWEVIKMGMCYGVLADGCLTDTSEGREIRIPLQLSVIETTPASTQTRADALNHPQVQAELFKVWNELSLRGGVTLSSYYGLSKTIYRALLPHLSDREVHQLITTEVELDMPDQTDDSQLMTKPQFMRWMASIALIWLETHCVAEALTFAQHLAVILQQPVERVDMDFVNAYGRKDPSLLIPTVPPRVVNGGIDKVLHYAREQYILTARVRFGSLLSDAPIVVKARVKKRQRHLAGKSIGVYMAPAVERATLAQGEDEEEASDPSRFANAENRHDDDLGQSRLSEQRDDEFALHGRASVSFATGATKSSPTQPRPTIATSFSPLRESRSLASRLAVSAVDIVSRDEDISDSDRDEHHDGTSEGDAKLRRSPALPLLRRCFDSDLQGNYFSTRFGLSSRGKKRRDVTTPEEPAAEFDPRRAIPPLKSTFVRLPTVKAASTPEPRRVTGSSALKTFKAPDASAAMVLRRLRASALDDSRGTSFNLRPDATSPWFKTEPPR